VQTLWLHNNELETVPVEISALLHLGLLSLNDNNIRMLPFEMSCLTQLSKLPLGNNPAIIAPPLEMAAAGDSREGCLNILKFFGMFRKGFAEPFVVDISGFGVCVCVCVCV